MGYSMSQLQKFGMVTHAHIRLKTLCYGNTGSWVMAAKSQVFDFAICSTWASVYSK